MRKTALTLGGVAALLTITGLSHAQPPAGGPTRIMQRLAMEKVPGGQSLSYGSDALQTLDYWPGKTKDSPLVIFVHGGGWKMGDKDNATGAAKVTHLTGEGYAFASIDYRLVPAATVEDQAKDVARATAWLIANAPKLGFDPTRVVLIGHSAGAQLVALVGTDPQYLTKAKLSLGAVRGIVALDGAAYDVPAQMKDGPPMMQSTYAEAFGTDPAKQAALSPTLQAAAPNAPAFLLFHIQRPDGIRQTQALAAALKAAGTAVDVQSIDGEGLAGHMELNRRLGEPDYPATPVLDAWLAKVFATHATE